MISYSPTAASDQTIIDLEAIDLSATIGHALDLAALAGDRPEVERLMRILFAEQLPALCGPANDHAIMRAIAANV